MRACHPDQNTTSAAANVDGESEKVFSEESEAKKENISDVLEGGEEEVDKLASENIVDELADDKEKEV